MKSELRLAITHLAAEKNLPPEVVLEALKAALLSALRKENPNISEVEISNSTDEIRAFYQYTVVEEVTNPRTEMSLEEALKLDPDIELDEMVTVPRAVQNAGRIAAQTAKQVVTQRLREAEREIVFEEFQDKEGDIVSGLIQRVEPRQIIIDLGKTEAVLPLSEQVRSENYRPGQRLKAYLLEVSRTNKGPQVLVSRTHRNLLRRLFELEVPEIFNGTVEIKAIAREPGYRSKVAVHARQEGVDPVGSCVGLRGIRIQNIINELNNEKVDVIQWHPDEATFVAHALSPAQVLEVEIDEGEKTATVVVPDRQLSLAIGKEGQNARLAAKLTGWRIDIKSSSSVEAERLERAREALSGPIGMETDSTTDLEPAVAALFPPVSLHEPAGLTLAAAALPAAERSAAVEALRPVAQAPAPVEAVQPIRTPEQADRRRRVRFAEELVDDARNGPAARTSRQEEEDAEKAAKRGKRAPRSRTGYTEEVDDEAEEYQDILRRIK